MAGPGVVVIGGGWAGLACASALAERDCPVTLLEERGRLGGRAHSFTDAATGEEVDNGQHLLMGGFREGRRFLRRIGTEAGIDFQRALRVPVVEGAGRVAVFACPPLPAPWHLAAGVLGHAGLSLKDKLRMLGAWRRMRRRLSAANGGAEQRGRTGTVEEWLDDLGQTPGSRRAFWHPLAVAALNEEPARAPGRHLEAVLREGLLASREGSRLGVPRVPLSQLVEPAARQYLEQRGSRVVLNAAAVGLRAEGGRIRCVVLRDGSEVAASEVVAAVPPRALARLLEGSVGERDPFRESLLQREGSPIVTIHLWFDRPVIDLPFAALLDSPVHWVFRGAPSPQGGGHRLTLVTSAARALSDRPAEELAALGTAEIQRFFPAARGRAPRHARVVKERWATYSPAPDAEGAPRTGYPNLSFAGDWSEDSLPGTLEAAARSGHRCAARLRPERESTAPRDGGHEPRDGP